MFTRGLLNHQVNKKLKHLEEVMKKNAKIFLVIVLFNLWAVAILQAEPIKKPSAVIVDMGDGEQSAVVIKMFKTAIGNNGYKVQKKVFVSNGEFVSSACNCPADYRFMIEQTIDGKKTLVTITRVSKEGEEFTQDDQFDDEGNKMSMVKKLAAAFFLSKQTEVVQKKIAPPPPPKLKLEKNGYEIKDFYFGDFGDLVEILEVKCPEGMKYCVWLAGDEYKTGSPLTPELMVRLPEQGVYENDKLVGCTSTKQEVRNEKGELIKCNVDSLATYWIKEGTGKKIKIKSRIVRKGRYSNSVVPVAEDEKPAIEEKPVTEEDLVVEEKSE
jgi:hypothetical protein